MLLLMTLRGMRIYISIDEVGSYEFEAIDCTRARGRSTHRIAFSFDMHFFCMAFCLEL
jgi:hypothetical protein